ncbi:unnamed protein product [Trichobilharzia regenti]|nr:unnamed protein product [Trichobilharzia regenti]
MFVLLFSLVVQLFSHSFNNNNNKANSGCTILHELLSSHQDERSNNDVSSRLDVSNDFVNEINDIRIKMTTIQHELNKQIEMNENLKSDNILLNNLIESMKKDQDILYHEKEDLIITNKQFEQTLLMKIENEKKLLADNQFLDQLVQLNDENKELRSMISEMNSYWQERQKKLEDRCRVLSARLKIERSSHRSSHYKSSSWIRSSMNILIPSKLKYNNKREMKRSQNEITSLNTTTNTINQHDSDTVERDGNDNNTNSNNNNTNHANEGIIDHSKADSQTDDSEISLTSLSEMESEYGQVAQESKLINNSKTRPMKSKEHGIQLLQLNNTISQLSEIQSSYNMLNQRNNSLIQQYQAMRTGKLKAEQLNKDLNNLIESLSNALRRSKRQNLQSKCIIEVSKSLTSVKRINHGFQVLFLKDLIGLVKGFHHKLNWVIELLENHKGVLEKCFVPVFWNSSSVHTHRCSNAGLSG